MSDSAADVTAKVSRTGPRRVRTRTRLQAEPAECGAAALGIVLEHFGSHVPSVTLRNQCAIAREGSKASNLLKAARFHGLEARVLKHDPEDLPGLPMPVIAQWNVDHFLVVEGFRAGRVYLNDPASGHRRVTDDEFERCFGGVVLSFAPGDDFVPVGARPRLLASLGARLRGARAAVLFLLLAGLGLVFTGVTLPVLGQLFVDQVLGAGRQDWLPVLLLGLGGTAALRAALTWLRRRYLARLQLRLAAGMASGSFWHLLRLPLAWSSARAAGDLARRIEQNEQLAGLLSGRLAEAALDLVLAVLYLGVIAAYDRTIAAVAGAAALALVGLLIIQGRTGADDSLRLADDRARTTAIAAGGLALIEALKATGSEGALFTRLAGHRAKLGNDRQRAARRDLLVAALAGGITRAGAVLVLGLGALRVMDGQLSLGALVAVQSLMASLLGPIAGLTTFGLTLHGLRGSLEQLDDLLQHAPDDPAPVQAHAHSLRAPRRLTGALDVQGVTFGHSPLAPPLLEGVDLRIQPGQRVALVGAAGSGKSTLARLACGLHQPWSGQILLDGEPHHRWPPSTVAAALAAVDQDATLFEGSVRDNLTLWDPSVPDSDLYRAAKDACIHDDILRLPGGYDAPVEEGGRNLSGGQRQRLELARALVGQPSLLVLDQATSALDPATEQRVFQNLRRRGVGCLVVTHRPAILRGCDEIVVLDRGRVIDRGSHDALMARGMRCRELVGS